MKKLNAEQIQEGLKELKDWSLQTEKLHRKFHFKNFVEAFGFMSQIAILAEKMNHHPEWSNIYNSVTIDLSTHDVSGISSRDFSLAKQIDIVASIFLK